MPRLETRYGLFDVPDAQNDLIGKHLAQDGEWAWLETQFISSNLPKGARVIDVGAFIGTFGIGLRCSRPDVRVAFVEANTTVLSALESNVGRLLEGNAPVISALLAGNHSRFTISQSEKDNAGSTFFRRDTVSVNDCSFQSLTLSEIRSKTGDFDFLKLDVEGLEAEIIESDFEYLSRPDISLWAECNEASAAIKELDALFLLKKPIYYFAWPAYWKGNFKQNQQPIFPWAFEAGLFASRTKPYLPIELQETDCILTRIETTSDLCEALWRTPRWGRREWLENSRAEIVALSGRIELGEEFSHFLDVDYQKPRPVHDRLAAAESLASLRLTQIRTLERQLEKLKINQEELEQMIASYKATSLETTALLGRERRKHSASQSELREKIQLLGRELQEMRRSSSWLLTAPLRRVATLSGIRRIFRKLRVFLAKSYAKLGAPHESR